MPTHQNEQATTQLVRVFAAQDAPSGGNPAPITLHADALSAEQMQQIATQYGHEAGFVLDSTRPDCRYRFRFFVPQHEMEMCGHATLGALWVLWQEGHWDGEPLRIETLSGVVEGELHGEAVRISQPVGTVTPVGAEWTERLARVLNVEPSALAGPVINAATSRIKTLIPLRDERALDALQPDWAAVEELCTQLGSTGLYPYAVVEPGHVYAARQFPRSSGYPEDAATGIAAAALAFGLLQLGKVRADPADSGSALVVRQGYAMGHPSQIEVAFRLRDGEVNGCWLSGRVVGNLSARAEDDHRT